MEASSLDVFVTQFGAPQLTPLQFLIVSSPRERKIVYTALQNFKSRTGRTYALIDSGLADPRGIALDRERGALYVADLGAKKIFRYRLIVTGANKMTTDGIQVTVIQDAQVEWVAVDVSGDIFYSDQGAKTINRIPEATLALLAAGEYQAGDLTFVSAKQQGNTSAALALQETTKAGVEEPPADAAPLKVFRMYEGSVNPHVTLPKGLATDGLHLFWANGIRGESAGAAVKGEVNPKQGSNPPTFLATALANNTNEAFGIAKSSNMVLFTSNSSGIGSVYGVMEGSSHVTHFVANLAEPRGLVWDGDQTVYVADQAANAVWSFPVGRLIDDAPLTKSVALNGAFGVALLSERDPAFSIAQAGAHGLHGESTLCMAMMLLAWCLLGGICHF